MTTETIDEQALNVRISQWDAGTTLLITDINGARVGLVATWEYPVDGSQIEVWWLSSGDGAIDGSKYAPFKRPSNAPGEESVSYKYTLLKDVPTTYDGFKALASTYLNQNAAYPLISLTRKGR